MVVFPSKEKRYSGMSQDIHSGAASTFRLLDPLIVPYLTNHFLFGRKSIYILFEAFQRILGVKVQPQYS